MDIRNNHGQSGEARTNYGHVSRCTLGQGESLMKPQHAMRGIQLRWRPEILHAMCEQEHIMHLLMNLR